MKPSDKAKANGCRDLKQVQEFTGYTRPTLNKMFAQKPKRFDALCVAAVCDELSIDGFKLRELHRVMQQIKEG